MHTFATSPEDVRLDHSLTTTAAWKLEGLTPGSERREVARAVADALADNLVTKLHALGLPAERASGPAPRDGIPTVVIDGQFLAIEEGNRTERVVIGLGAGKSQVRTAVQVIELLAEENRLLDTFEIDAKSGSMPGMAETMGAGAAAGNLGIAAVASGAVPSAPRSSAPTSTPMHAEPATRSRRCSPASSPGKAGSRRNENARASRKWRLRDRALAFPAFGGAQLARDDLIQATGAVEKILGGGRYQISLDGGQTVTAQLSGRMRRFRIRVIPGDRVQVGLSPYDPSHGFITFRLREGEGPVAE